jgi:hypothetical protein
MEDRLSDAAVCESETSHFNRLRRHLRVARAVAFFLPPKFGRLKDNRNIVTNSSDKFKRIILILTIRMMASSLARVTPAAAIKQFLRIADAG